jgi:hypothetical protein
MRYGHCRPRGLSWQRARSTVRNGVGLVTTVHGATSRCTPGLVGGTMAGTDWVVSIGSGGRYHSKPRTLPAQLEGAVLTTLLSISTSGWSVPLTVETTLNTPYSVSSFHAYFLSFKLSSLSGEQRLLATQQLIHGSPRVTKRMRRRCLIPWVRIEPSGAAEGKEEGRLKQLK